MACWKQYRKKRLSAAGLECALRHQGNVDFPFDTKVDFCCLSIQVPSVWIVHAPSDPKGEFSYAFPKQGIDEEHTEFLLETVLKICEVWFENSHKLSADTYQLTVRAPQVAEQEPGFEAISCCFYKEDLTKLLSTEAVLISRKWRLTHKEASQEEYGHQFAKTLTQGIYNGTLSCHPRKKPVRGPKEQQKVVPEEKLRKPAEEEQNPSERLLQQLMAETDAKLSTKVKVTREQLD